MCVSYIFLSGIEILWLNILFWRRTLKRNPSIVISQLHETKAHSIITKSDCIIQFPKRFLERGMAEIGSDTYVFGMYALIMSNNYAISTIPAMVRTNPSRISETEIDGVLYFNFHYNAGDVLIENTNVIRKDTLIYNLTEEFFLKGNVPWYISYEDLGKIYDKAQEFADSNVAKNYATMEAIAAYISRSPKDRAIHLRHILKTRQDVNQTTPTYIGIYGNVFYAAPGTVNKLAGSYFQDAVVSALVQPSNKASHVESLLRV